MSNRLIASLVNASKDFRFIPDYFSKSEQKLLLDASLLKLDASGSRRFQRRRQARLERSERSGFLPDEYYEFIEVYPRSSNKSCCYFDIQARKGHYDGVIHNYREALLNSWPLAEIPTLSPVLNRLHSLLPSQNIQTHLLHLASDGEILPHVDNVDASGRWILGVSLGSERILRLEKCENSEEAVEIPLPPGSVYLQSDSIRFDYKHSILKSDTMGQRMSIMIRDLPDIDKEHPPDLVINSPLKIV
ncbi:hypothetical protein D9757_001802 [Collybiopsis confluens]|uniref:Alpha-ketoglutarate-dependent dioxygenase AlkB-like domain-containing protein n=1 Tax=Collybiopsis confluens TaxID=2823264 RepID=A0A8H5HYG4_9AGAR|nr:hypothetical protein D9757_001802 [Collybiopsis confluens]